LRALELALLVLVLGAAAMAALHRFYSMVNVGRDQVGQLIAIAASTTLLVVIVGLVCVLVLMSIGAGQAKQAVRVHASFHVHSSLRYSSGGTLRTRLA